MNTEPGVNTSVRPMVGEGPAWAGARRALVTGTAFALIGAALYGANIPAARFSSQAGMPGADLIFYRALILVPLLAVLALAMRVPLRLGPGERGTILRLAIAAGLTATFYLSALDHLSVPLTVVVFYTFPLIVMVVSNRLEGRRLSPRQMAIFAAAFAGLMIAVGPSFDQLTLRGVTYALLAACACASMFILAGRVEGPAIRTMFWVQLCTMPISLTVAMLNGGPVPLSTFANAPVAISITMTAYAIGFVFQLLASQRISPSRAGLLFLFEPVTAILIAGIVLGEILSPIQIAGVALILTALAAEMLLDAPRPAPLRSADGNAHVH